MCVCVCFFFFFNHLFRTVLAERDVHMQYDVIRFGLLLPHTISSGWAVNVRERTILGSSKIFVYNLKLHVLQHVVSFSVLSSKFF